MMLNTHGLKLKGNNDADKQFWKTLRSNVHQYFTDNHMSAKGNYYMCIKTTAIYLFYLVPLILFFILPVPGFVAILMAVLMGIGKAGIGMSVMHDGLHGSYSSKKWVNRLAGASMYMIGSNVFNWKIQHN